MHLSLNIFFSSKCKIICLLQESPRFSLTPVWSGRCGNRASCHIAILCVMLEDEVEMSH